MMKNPRTIPVAKKWHPEEVVNEALVNGYDGPYAVAWYCDSPDLIEIKICDDWADQSEFVARLREVLPKLIAAGYTEKVDGKWLMTDLICGRYRDVPFDHDLVVATHFRRVTRRNCILLEKLLLEHGGSVGFHAEDVNPAPYEDAGFQTFDPLFEAQLMLAAKAG